MIDQLKFLEKIDWFYYWRSNDLSRLDNIHRLVDINKLENLISLESVGGICYQSISHMVHNQGFRNKCQRFEQKAQLHQMELRRLFTFSLESEISIENKRCKYLLELEPSYLSFRSVMNLAISLTAYKIDAYKYLCHIVQEHSGLLNGFVDDCVKEIHFLRCEKKLYVQEMWGTDINVSLD